MLTEDDSAHLIHAFELFLLAQEHGPVAGVIEQPGGHHAMYPRLERFGRRNGDSERMEAQVDERGRLQDDVAAALG